MYAERESFPIPNVVSTNLRMGDESGIELVARIHEQQAPLARHSHYHSERHLHPVTTGRGIKGRSQRCSPETKPLTGLAGTSCEHCS
jgi:hypothetical protein